MRRRTLVTVLAASAVLVGSGGFVIGSQLLPGGERSGSPMPTGSASARNPTPTPATTPAYASPRRDRPVVELSYEVAADHGSVTGEERVSFTPDRKVCDSLVFRAWPNKPEVAEGGGSMTVDHAEVDGEEVRPRVQRRGVPRDAQGSLVRVPLRSCVAAGDSVEARLAFTVTMAKGSGERVGTNGSGEMWFASAYPVLAWEHGHGWMTEPAVDVFGEMDGAEEFRLTLDIVAPSDDTVLGTGRALGRGKGTRPGTTRHRFAAGSVRNVAVSVGGYEVTERTISGVRTRLGVSDDGTLATATTWLDEIEREMGKLERRFGRFPHGNLWVTVVPDTTGIEFPGAIFYGDQSPRDVTGGDLVAHELAHMWFYSLVGNNQGRDPWLDEAFATYAQALADGQEGEYLAPMRVPPAGRNKVGKPMTYWEKHSHVYGVAVYRQGAKMLFEARERAGRKRWDAAMHDYVTENAHRIARPQDFVAAVDHLPGAVDTLERYGAVS